MSAGIAGTEATATMGSENIRDLGDLARRLAAVQAASVCATDMRPVCVQLARAEDKLLRLLKPRGDEL